MGAQFALFDTPEPGAPRLDGPLGSVGVVRLLERLERLDELVARSRWREIGKREKREERRRNAHDGRSRRWVPLWTGRLRDERAYRRRLERERELVVARLRRPDVPASIALAGVAAGDVRRAVAPARAGTTSRLVGHLVDGHLVDVVATGLGLDRREVERDLDQVDACR